MTLALRRLRPRRALVAAATLAAVALAAACDDGDDITGEDEPDVDRMELSVGTSVVNVSASGQVTGGPLVLPRGTSTVTARFLRQDGTPDPQVTTTEFRLAAYTLPSGATFTATAGTFAGALSMPSVLAGQALTIGFSLFHVGEQHDDFGPFPVPVRVQ